jgi:hypothetical protein
MRAPPSPPDDEGTLPNSKLDILDTGYFTWEDGADEYAAHHELVGRRLRGHRRQPCLSELWAPRVATRRHRGWAVRLEFLGEFSPDESGSAGVGIRG